MILSDKTEADLNRVMKNLSTELVSDRGEVLGVLTDSKENGTAVGIHAPVLGEGIIVTAVEEIIMSEEIMVVLKNYDRTGYILGTNKLKLADIESVCPFKSAFENPFMRSLKNKSGLD